MSYKVEKVTEPVLLGEGPHWDGDEKALYYVSILENTIHKYVPSSGLHSKTKLADSVGFIVPVEKTKHQFIVGLGRKFVIIEWDGYNGSDVKIIQELAEVDTDIKTTRINDGKVDPRGRLFAGTMGKEDPPGQIDPDKGSLFRLQSIGVANKLATNIGISNGLAWDLKQKAFYYIDSLEKAVTKYDYDVDTGDISNKRHIFDFIKHKVEGVPDGMTIDTTGNLWVAVFQGSCIININPITGELLQKIPIPASQVTSVTFGGENLDVLYVTTASMKIISEQLPPCGATFQVTGLGVKGYPNMSFSLKSLK